MTVVHTVRDLVRHWADQTPNAPAIVSLEGDVLTYIELASRIDASATAIRRRGVAAHDRVAIVLPNGPLMAAAFLATTAAAAAAPLNPGLTDAEFRYYFDDLDIRLLIAESTDTTAASHVAREMGIEVLAFAESGVAVGSVVTGSAHHDEELVLSDENDVALVLHTSGTTARPKMVPLSHRNLVQSATNVATTLELAPRDRCLNVMPLFHIHGLVAALLGSLSAGASVVCTPGFSAVPFLRWIDTHAPTWYTAVPTMHQAILARLASDVHPVTSLRFIRSSSASLPPSVLAALEDGFGVPVIEAYGMTEASHQMTSNRLPPGIRKPGSVGMAAGPEVNVLTDSGVPASTDHVGEVAIKGENVMSGDVGMVDRARHFVDDEWFRTGDQGYLDPDGFLFLTGRLKEIINRGGETIAPREIDEVMLDIEGILQAVAFSVPDEILGEEVAAVVIPQDGAVLTEAEIQTRVAERLSFAKVPKRVIFTDAIPKGPTGKLQRIGLADKLGVTSVRAVQASSTDAVSATGERLATLWMEVLEVAHVGPDEPFLEAGGDSIAATALAVGVEEEFDIDLPLLAFYDAATIRSQAELIDALVATSNDA